MKCVQVPCGLVDVDPSLSMRRVDLFSTLSYRCKLSCNLAMFKSGRFIHSRLDAMACIVDQWIWSEHPAI